MRGNFSKKISTFFLIMLVIIFGVSLTVSADQSELELSPITLTWVAGGVGGGWYTQAGGLAQLINENEPKITIKVVPGGGLVNPVRVSTGEDDLGWGITFVDKAAFDGQAPLYEEPYPDVRAIGAIFGIYNIHFVAAKNQGIETIKELMQMVKDGKAIKIAAPMKGTSDLPIVEEIFNFYGVSLDDVEKAGGKVFHAVYADMVSLYQDHHVDFVATHLSIPAAAVTEMTVGRDSIILAASEELIDYCHEELGTIARESGLCVIPANTYKGQEKDVPVVVTAGELLVNKDVSDEVVYTILKIFDENIEQVYQIDRTNRYFIPEDGWKNVGVPLHPGAEKYYKEAGYME
ncbi:MAG: TAXI family TRAP transporter solute-binding subunit [Candidatus Atribacteria bacterium]|nr:TAXI family TRAP transporter solute-binding subunit [Candidatus Atribacteria bacterium]